GRQLGPWPRHLDVALLEDGLSALALDDGRADVPLDLVIRVHTFGHEVPGETQPDARAARQPGRRLPRLPPPPPPPPRPPLRPRPPGPPLGAGGAGGAAPRPPPRPPPGPPPPPPPPTTSLLPRPLHGHRHHPPALPDIAFR